MDKHCRRIFALAVVVLVPYQADAWAQSSSGVANQGADVWPLEELSLRTGAVLKGLIESESPGSVEFTEVVRQRGKRPYLVVRTIRPRDIAERRPLPKAQRRELAERVDGIRNRARILRRETAAIPLSREPDGRWRYKGRSFSFLSTADEQTSRRAIVRLEQMFSAFRQILRPQHTAPKRPLRFLFFGSLAQYRKFLRSEGLEIDNPAFYSPEQNLVAAGSELAAVAAEIAASEARHRDILTTYREAADARRKKLREAIKRKKELGWSAEECRELVQATERRLRADLADVRRRIRTAERRQETRFDEHTRRLFALLYHEAFHAYVENFVCESARHDVPVWLNEGLAQLFESARVDVGELRLDVVDEEKLAALRVELKRKDTISVRDVLHADRDAFLVQHRVSGTSRRHYIVAWAVAYYLTHDRNLLASERLAEYVARDRTKENHTKRFERLIGEKLDVFQRTWRDHMMGLPVETKR